MLSARFKSLNRKGHLSFSSSALSTFLQKPKLLQRPAFPPCLLPSSVINLAQTAYAELTCGKLLERSDFCPPLSANERSACIRAVKTTSLWNCEQLRLHAHLKLLSVGQGNARMFSTLR